MTWHARNSILFLLRRGEHSCVTGLLKKTWRVTTHILRNCQHKKQLWLYKSQRNQVWFMWCKVCDDGGKIQAGASLPVRRLPTHNGPQAHIPPYQDMELWWKHIQSWQDMGPYSNLTIQFQDSNPLWAEPPDLISFRRYNLLPIMWSCHSRCLKSRPHGPPWGGP